MYVGMHIYLFTYLCIYLSGVSNFVHAFVAETHALARAHIAARGGNAALHFVSDLKLLHHASKNHAYGVMHCHADAVVVRPRMVRPSSSRASVGGFSSG